MWFRRSKKFGPFRVTFSNSGISASVGAGGARLGVNSRGTYASASKFGLSTGPVYLDRPAKAPAPPVEHLFVREDGLNRDELAIKSAPLAKLSSPEWSEKIASAYAAKAERAALIRGKSAMEREVKRLERRAEGRGFFALFPSSYKREASDHLRHLDFALVELESQVEEVSERADIDLGDTGTSAYSKLASSFDALAGSAAVWDLTSETLGPAYRANVERTVDRSPTRFRRGVFPDIDSETEALCFTNVNGPDILVYPSVVVARESAGRVAFISRGDTSIQLRDTRFREDERVPSDAEVVGSAWKYENKNGTRDKRFSDNREIPVCRYGVISIETNTGVREEFMVSNVYAMIDFAHAFNDHQKALAN